MSAQVLSIWTVTADPSGFPGQFVARRHEVGGLAHGPTSDHFAAETLEELRSMLPPGLICLARAVGDDPVIVECWL